MRRRDKTTLWCMRAGKTHTMHGPPEDPGVYMRALQELFAATAAADGHAPGDGAGPAGSIAVAMLEIYNEEVRDLLAAGRGNKALEVSGLGAGQLPAGAPCHLTPQPLPCVMDLPTLDALPPSLLYMSPPPPWVLLMLCSACGASGTTRGMGRMQARSASRG
jgi:hypothetical protein